MEYSLNSSQIKVVQSRHDLRLFVTGEAGTGKTTAAVERLKDMLRNGIAGESILIITPQRTLASPYITSMGNLESYNGAPVVNLTIGGLARRMIGTFWPLISDQAGFAHPDNPPNFLTLETVQYFISQLVRPLLDEGYFSSVTIDRNRLYSQIVDNLNKSAVVGFDYHEIAERLKDAWSGDPAQLRVYDDAQHCATLFRDHCLHNNLLDFSLQIEIFQKYIWTNDLCRQYLISSYRHLIIDNLEEDTPVAHDLISDWLPECASALLILDQDAGYRRFLGASPETASLLQDLCDDVIQFSGSLIMDPQVREVKNVLTEQIINPGSKPPITSHSLTRSIHYEVSRFFPAMLDWVCESVGSLINDQDVYPGEISVLSPFLSDALRFSIISRLTEMGIPARSHRPSRALRDEPAALCILTLTLLAHPQWFKHNSSLSLNKFDLAHTLVQAIENLDLIRAQLLTSTLVKSKHPGYPPSMGTFEQLVPEMQERISFSIGEKYETIRRWIAAYQEQDEIELDFFISQLFGELLSQPGFGFHNNFHAAEITANLIESVQKFRRSVQDHFRDQPKPYGLEYIEMVHDGIIASQYIRSWDEWDQEAVLIAPAYTFLMYNKPVDYQIWLDIGSRNWAERLYQPLTQPYILNRTWERTKVWTDHDEVATSRESLLKLVSGLLTRCRHGVFLGFSNYGEQGYEQRGPLLSALYKTLLIYNEQ